MEPYLVELLNRTLDDSDKGLHASADRIAFKALREAEKLADPGYINQLMTYADREQSPDRRDRAYFFLAHIAHNVPGTDIIHYLIGKTHEETSQAILCTLFNRLTYLDKPSGTDLTGIIARTRSLDFMVRHSAISALVRTSDANAERAVLALLEDPITDSDLLYCNRALAKIGTIQSVPQLVCLLKHTSKEVSDSALYALTQIADGTFLPVFIEELNNGRNKATALLGVVKFGNETSIPAISNRIHQLSQRKRVVQVFVAANKTEIIYAMEFLSTFIHQSPTPKALYHHLLKKQEQLWPVESLWLTMNKDLFK